MVYGKTGTFKVYYMAPLQRLKLLFFFCLILVKTSMQSWFSGTSYLNNSRTWHLENNLCCFHEWGFLRSKSNAALLTLSHREKSTYTLNLPRSICITLLFLGSDIVAWRHHCKMAISMTIRSKRSCFSTHLQLKSPSIFFSLEKGEEGFSQEQASHSQREGQDWGGPETDEGHSCREAFERWLHRFYTFFEALWYLVANNLKLGLWY